MSAEEDNVHELFMRAQRIVEEAKFVISSIPNVDEPSVQRSLRQLRAVHAVLTSLNDPYTTQEEIDGLSQLVLSLAEPLEALIQAPPSRRSAATELPDGTQGRPRQILDIERALELHHMGSSWSKVARAMGTTRQTLYNRLKESGLSSARPAHTALSDDELDELVADISLKHPLAGSTMIQGQLQGMEINIPLHRVKESLRRVDAIGVLLRWNGVIRRRVYKVRGSNALWHMDGNEKLRPWGFYIHGCVDGHSRTIIYLQCSNNKRSRTVERIFRSGVAIYGWPSRVRGDFGTENNRVEVIMVLRWGEFHRAFLRGRSIHNVRIERLWRDVRRYVLELFRQLFLHLERCGLLDMDVPVHRIALYLVYESRIQQSLDEMVASWNHHKLRTEGNLSPIAMFELSREDAITQGYWTGDPGDNIEGVDDLYGVDGEGLGLGEQDEGGEERRSEPPSLAEERDAGIFVNEDEEILRARQILKDVDLTRDDDNYGIDVFTEAVLILESCL